MQKTLVTFSLTLMLKVRVLSYYCRGELIQTSFELIHIDKNMKRNERFIVLVLENSLSVYTKE